MRKVPVVIGHRGAPGYRPEHTRSSYELAIEMGVDAIEPDVVATADGVLVVRHENEISTTTDVAEHPEFAHRKTTKMVDGHPLTGWFTEDFTWEELSTLRCRERLPQIRPSSASFDGRQPILRLTELLDLVREASFASGREIGVVLEIKHATNSAALGLDLAELVERDLRASGWAEGEWPLTIESFEQGVLEDLQARHVSASYVYLLEAKGTAYDLFVAEGRNAPTYADQLSSAGLDALASRVDGISVNKAVLLGKRGERIVADARARGLKILTWTCRPENAFLAKSFRSGGSKSEFGDWRAEWAAIARLGVDGVFVDHPDLGMEFFRPQPIT